MKDVFSGTRVQGYLTREERYFEQEPAIGIDNRITRLTEIILENAKKHELDIEPIQNIIFRNLFS